MFQFAAHISRPVVIIGKLAGAVRAQLLQAEPTLFEKCITSEWRVCNVWQRISSCSQLIVAGTNMGDARELRSQFERLKLVEYTQKQESEFVCVTVDDVQKVAQQVGVCVDSSYVAGFIVCLFVCLFVCLSVCLFVCLSDCLCLSLFVSLSVCLCLSHVYVSLFLTICFPPLNFYFVSC